MERYRMVWKGMKRYETVYNGMAKEIYGSFAVGYHRETLLNNGMKRNGTEWNHYLFPAQLGLGFYKANLFRRGS